MSVFDLDATKIASLCLHEPQHWKVQLQSTEHRISILKKFPDIEPGARILEIGCGQGDTTAVLAELVGDKGHVTAVDPGPLNYGSPFTLGQAQSHLSAGRLGSRITWVQADPIDFLSKSPADEIYDVTILVLCTWYFRSPSVLREIFTSLVERSRLVWIAEWALSSPIPKAHTHILAALTQAALESHNPNPTSNIRIAISHSLIKDMARSTGWISHAGNFMTPAPTVLDGRWETMAVKSQDFLNSIHEHVESETQKSLVIALRDATLESLQVNGGIQEVHAMDVWCTEFTKSEG